MNSYAFIPARANSKRVPGKNFKLLAGKPLIYYTIKAAIESNVEKVYFSTENSELAELANDIAFQLDRTGAKFDILLRHQKLSLDSVQTDSVYWDMLLTLMESPSLSVPDTLVLLQPTSPMRNSVDINNALKQWRTSEQKGCLVSGYEVDGFLWMNDGEVKPVNHDPRFRLGKQWIENPVTHFVENGAIYITNTEQFHLYRTYRMPPYQMYAMDKRKSVDIDTTADFNRASELVNFL